jgi:D-beta-D-heptose 7-phosphate kinase/D-beta-D-heptose 1-phosphate adenosyltransferase
VEKNAMRRQKIYPAKELKTLLDKLRQQGQRVVFTNGCFDLLHPGHLHTLYAAKSQGDVLVVGINADASVRKLKGKGRPILAEAERAAVLSALEMVDFVTIFAEETPLELIRLLEPDVLVKGGDWTPATMVGREVVEGQGGKVVMVPYQAGFSTTAIIARIRQADP